MQAAVRSYKTMGVALVGASVVAVSPLAPPMPHVQAVERAVSSAGVELDALVNPIEAWVQVLQAAGANLGAIGQELIDNPTPILSQVIANQTANAQQFGASAQADVGLMESNLQTLQKNLPTVAAQIQAGNFTGALATFNNDGFTQAALALLQIPEDALVPAGNMAQNFANVMATLPTDLAQVVLPSLLPVVSALYAVAQTGDDVTAGVAAGNVGAVVNALVNAPANLVGGLLNGAGNILGYFPGAGILTPYDTFGAGFLDSGPISSLNNLREVIAEALGKPVPVAPTTSDAVTQSAAVSAIASVPTASKIAKLPATSANLVTLDAASPAKDVSAVALTATSGAATSEASAATTATKPSRVNPAKDVSAGIRKALKHVGDGSTNAAAGIGAKSSSTSTGNSKSSAGGSNGGGRHRAGK